MSNTRKDQSMIVRQQTEHNVKLLDYVNKKRKEGVFNDVTIQVGGKRISANRMILSCFSKFFEAMFRVPLKERHHDTVVIKEFDGDAVSSLIEYIYTGNIDITAGNVMALLSAAVFLQMDDVKKFCFDFFKIALSVETCTEIFKSSVTYNNQSPLNKTLQIITSNFDTISEQDTFTGMSKDELSLLISNFRQFNVGEKYLYSAVLNWVKHDDNRKQYFASFFLDFDLDKLSIEFIEDEVAEEPLVKESNDCINAIVQRMVRKTKESRRKANAPQILCVGGEKNYSTMEVYNSIGKSSISYPYLPRSISNHCLLILNDIIYCLGGISEEIFNAAMAKKVYQMNLKDQNLQWREGKPLIASRYEFGAATFGEHLLVAGGRNGDANSKLKSAELFEAQSNRWKSIAPLNEARNRLAMTVADGDVFAIGGLSSLGTLSLVERLHDLNKTWMKVQPMNTQRHSLAAVSCNDLVYAIGGTNSQWGAEKSVEVFDPKKNHWSYVASMNKGRRCHAACVLQGKIFVVGGIDRKHEAVTSIECYDPSVDKWSTVDEVDCKLVGHAIVSLHDNF